MNALVVSGGGAKGAFAVGALERLWEHFRDEGIELDIAAGTSVGGLIVPLVATGEIQLLRGIFADIWTWDIVRQRNPVGILFGDSVYDTAPVERIIDNFITQERYQRIVNSATTLYLSTVNLQTGDIEYWTQRQNAPLKLGEPVPSPGQITRHTLLRAILATGNMPVLMPPVSIRQRNVQHVDGGVREIVPFRIAIDHGATRIFAIILSPATNQPRNEEFISVVSQLSRTIDLFSRETVVNEVEQAGLYTNAALYLRELQARTKETLRDRIGGLSSAEADEIVDDIFNNTFTRNPFENRGPLELYIIRPREALPAGSLDFDPNVMAQMIAFGARAAEQVLAQGPMTFPRET